MSNDYLLGLLKRRIIGKTLILIASLLIIYFLGCIYFANHYFLHTIINGVNVSLRTQEDADQIIKSYIDGYELRLLERNNETEIIKGQDIGMRVRKNNSISQIDHKQKSWNWVCALFMNQQYNVKDLYTYNKDEYKQKINELCCVKKDYIRPRNVSFRYLNGAYQVIQAEFGDKPDKSKLYKTVKASILQGKEELNLDANSCYENPRYTLSSSKTKKTAKLLNKYISAMIVYKIGNDTELLDGAMISRWLKVDDDIDVEINKKAVVDFVTSLGKKYDTVGIERKFTTFEGKIITIKGGLYGWKINRDSEVEAILNYISLGEVMEREPIYTQTALCQGEDDIGNTYIEINITRQHLWFYKEGKLITDGAVVTGNPNRGNATVLGTYMIVYKQKLATLKGPGYEVQVTYWMPFYGNMGIHDAKWRHSFGGEIYKHKGTHGCVNAPVYLAKKIYENIEEGIPVICYEE
jgi:hypothetical protein